MYLTNLWYIIKTTVPLMFLAGFLGAIVITLIPWDTMSGLFAGQDDRTYGVFRELGIALIGMSIVAMVGIFLPVPIAFDVMIVAILFSAGMPVHYAMTLLFTLGIFSIYPFIIVWRDISRSVAVALTIVLSIAGVGAGATALGYQKWDTARKTELFLQTFQDADTMPEVAADRGGLDGAALWQQLGLHKRSQAELVTTSGALTVERTPFVARSGGDDLSFEKVEGNAVGIDEPSNFSLSLFTRPYEYRGAIATGDIHNDGWADVAISSTDHLVSLYANLGNGQFALQELNLAGLPELSGAFVFLVSLVDLNNDGWLDLFFSTYGQGNWVVYNTEGEFNAKSLRHLPNITSAMTASASFGDFDKDGDLDGALGNWVPWEPHPLSQNALLVNEPDGFEAVELPGMISATLSTLLTDFDGDGNLDLFATSEFRQPDVIYQGDGAGGFDQIGADRKMFPFTTESTMSIASADIDNDLRPELYFGQITGRSTNTGHAREAAHEQLCAGLSRPDDRAECETDVQQWQLVKRSLAARDTLACQKISDPVRREECVVAHLGRAATKWFGDESYCDMLPARWVEVRDNCHMSFDKSVTYTEAEYAENIPQIRNHNVLLQMTDDGSYVDRAKELGIDVTGWTWNAKFADLNNDEWVDLFAVNGAFSSKTRESNYLFENDVGKGFIDRSVEAGIIDYFPTPAYSYVDIDNDGDLDIITAPTHGPVSVLHNRSGGGNGIAFELRDMVGNRFGIGASVVIHYGNGSNQMREIQSGGGFASFDPAVAYFGLGGSDEVSQVEIRWPTSETSVIEGPFKSGASYRITRNATVAATE